MKTLYILILIMSLTGCSWDMSEARSTTSAFLNNCKLGTIVTNLVTDGNNKTLTITCTKEYVK
jgi:hypothetical protein